MMMVIALYKHVRSKSGEWSWRFVTAHIARGARVLVVAVHKRAAQALAAEGSHTSQTGELSQHTLVFCKGNYTATAAAVGSYLHWDPTAILAGLRQSRVPTTLILGSADRYLPRDWVSRLRRHHHRRSRTGASASARLSADAQHDDRH